MYRAFVIAYFVPNFTIRRYLARLNSGKNVEWAKFWTRDALRVGWEDTAIQHD